ncbi:helix-turn-helix transcriptional regulator [Corallococcus exercitus]|uniref:Helix-turn-helix transcriptional regulator n=2 Tax=Corallococcus exercitus TaxID=2316736 RepID=A0A7Y4KLH4_9BACT|nr:winged helix-turn-helix transcriptional regulator [Corallococcus exercitus]NOK35490.1 helix-turn-helix transcriptional regulator [Corallococcus exercitus]
MTNTGSALVALAVLSGASARPDCVDGSNGLTPRQLRWALCWGPLHRPRGQSQVLQRSSPAKVQSWRALLLRLLHRRGKRRALLLRLRLLLGELSLKGLEQNGLVKRTLFASVPPRVDDALTPLGRTLVEPLRALKEWTRVHQDDLREARRDHARRAVKPW